MVDRIGLDRRASWAPFTGMCSLPGPEYFGNQDASISDLRESAELGSRLADPARDVEESLVSRTPLGDGPTVLRECLELAEGGRAGRRDGG